MTALQPDLAAPRRVRGAGQNLRLVLLVGEGYAYLIGTIAIFGAVVAILAWGLLAREPVVGILALFLGAPTVLLTGAALQSVVFSVPEPTGVRLSAAAAPSMMSMIEELRREVGCHALDGVLVVTGCNASAFQAGGLRRRRNLLLIGYPLLVVLSPDQLKAVVAHELAHFGNGDSRLAGLVYRTRASWFRLAEVLDERGTMPIFVRWVLSAYLPRLEAGSAEVARAHEYFADRAAALVSSPRAAAEALVTNALVGELLETRFWPSVAERLEPRTRHHIRSHRSSRQTCSTMPYPMERCSTGSWQLLRTATTVIPPWRSG